MVCSRPYADDEMKREKRTALDLQYSTVSLLLLLLVERKAANSTFDIWTKTCLSLNFMKIWTQCFLSLLCGDGKLFPNDMKIASLTSNFAGCIFLGFFIICSHLFWLTSNKQLQMCICYKATIKMYHSLDLNWDWRHLLNYKVQFLYNWI